MKLIVGVAVAGVAFAAMMPGRSGGGTSTPHLETKLATVADAMGAILPKRLDGGMLLTGVTAQGRTLVVRFSEVPDWRGELTDVEAGKLMSRMICRQGGIGDAVRQGGTIRFAFTATTGETLPSLDVDRCPA